MYCQDKLNFLQTIEAVLPAYDHLGNNTCQIISSQAASTTLPMSVPKFIRLWFQFLHIDLYAQRFWSGKILRQRNLNPLIIDKDYILIPIKLRKPIGEKDSCYGYFRLNSIQNITADYILLANGNKVPYLSSLKTIHNKMHHGMLLDYIYLDEIKRYHMFYYLS